MTVVSAITAILRALGLPCVIILAGLGFYEGVPLVRELPLVGVLPVIGELAVGRVRAEAARAASEARAGYVSLAEKLSLAAELAEIRRQRDAGARVISDYRERLALAEAAEHDAIEQLEREISDHERQLDLAGRACRLDAGDIGWLRRN